MTLQQLTYILEISKCGSISGAAKNLFIAQPSLSKAIKSLEKELGITILERGRRGTVFTAEGLELLGYASGIIEHTVDLKEHFNKNNVKNIQFSISSQHYIFAVDALMDIVNKMGSSSHYAITIREGKTSDIINDVLIRRSDIGLIFISNLTRNFINRLFHKNGIEFTPLGEYIPYVYINKNHPLAKQKSVSVEMLFPYPYVKYEQHEVSYNYSEEIIIPDVVDKYIYVTDRSTMLSFIKNTNAYNIGSGFLLPSIIDKDIITLPISNITDKMQIGWIKQKNTVLTPEMEEYIKHLSVSIKRCSFGNRYTDNLEENT